MKPDFFEENVAYFQAQNHCASFEVLPGKGKVLLSSPHSVPQLRNGKEKEPEYSSGAIVRCIHERTNCFGITKTKNCGDDANYDVESPYRDEIVQLVKENSICCLLDIHQLRADRDMWLDFGIGEDGANLLGNTQLFKMVEEAFTAWMPKEKVVTNELYKASRPYTVCADVATRAQIPCIQIEINSSLVSSEYSQNQTEKVLDTFQQIVEKINQEEWV